MDYDLDNIECRVLGCLIEKALSTPEYYPLSLNAITTACNQKNNREPVLKLDNQTIHKSIKSLMDKQLAWEKSTSGNRVTKFAHKLSGTLSKTIDFTQEELAIIGELLLRGAQTPSELRSRTSRMFEFPTLDAVGDILQKLRTHHDQPFVRELPRQAGRRENRFIHLLSADSVTDSDIFSESLSTHQDHAHNLNPPPDRLSALEKKVATLESELAELKMKFLASR